MKISFLCLILITLSAGFCPAEDDPSKAIVMIADKIKALGDSYPQLKEFSPESHLNKKEMKIVYGFHTHAAQRSGGWTSGVPNPDPDGIWFYIDFHDASSKAQIHTQPLEFVSHYIGDKKLQFLILEGKSTKSVSGELWKIFKSVGVTEQQNVKSKPMTVSDVADYSDPIKTYKTFLEAIKRDDLAAARACCTISDDNKSGALDVLIGMWVTFHRFNNVALMKFKDETSPYLRDDGADKQENPYLRTDCTDQALDRTISRLSGSKFKIEGDKAKLTVKWEKNDGYPNPAFFFSGDDDRLFRQIDGQWKLDMNPPDNSEKPADLFRPGSWGCAFRDGMNLMNAVIEEIESGQLKTWKQVTEQLEKRTEVLGRKWAQDHEAEEHQGLEIKPGGKAPPAKERQMKIESGETCVKFRRARDECHAKSSEVAGTSRLGGDRA